MRGDSQKPTEDRKVVDGGTQMGWVKEGSSLHCFRGVKGRLTARLV